MWITPYPPQKIFIKVFGVFGIELEVFVTTDPVVFKSLSQEETRVPLLLRNNKTACLAVSLKKRK